MDYLLEMKWLDSAGYQSLVYRFGGAARASNRGTGKNFSGKAISIEIVRQILAR